MPNQYAKFSQNPGNKMSLVTILLNDWKEKKGYSFQGKKFMQRLAIKVSTYLRTMVQFKWPSYVT